MKPRHIAQCVALACGGIAATATLAQAPQPTPPPPAAAQQLERVTITGSNIRRTDQETVAPVTVITREQIERSGQPTREGINYADRALQASRDFRGQPGGSNVQSLTGGGTWQDLLANGAPVFQRRAHSECAPQNTLTYGQAVTAGLINDVRFDLPNNTWCRYDLSKDWSALPGTERLGLISRATVDFSASTQAFVEAGLSRNVTRLTLSPGSQIKFHLARLFKQALGTTPHLYLQRKRTQVARRLIDTTDMDIGEVAAATGFGSRWTMYRFLRKSFGAGGRSLRDKTLAA